jgi:hypothetical protein
MARRIWALVDTDGLVDDLMVHTASWAVLVTARHRVRRKIGDPTAITDIELHHLQRLLLRGRFHHETAWWDPGQEKGKPFVRQQLWEQIVGYALFWTLSAAWAPVRHGSVFGSASGTPIGPHGPFAFADGRGALDAVEALKMYLPRPRGAGDGFVVIADRSRTFENLRHDMVMKRLETRIIDELILDLVADFLESVQTTDGIGVGRGGPLATLMADIAFAYVDWNWPEIGVRHRMQSCYLHPWHDAAPGNPPEDWITDLFAPLRDLLHPVQKNSRDAVYALLTQQRGRNDSVADSTALGSQVVEAVADTADTYTSAEAGTPCPSMEPARLVPRICGTGSPSSIYMRYVDDSLVAGEGGPGRALPAYEALRQQMADLNVSVNLGKRVIGSLYDGFDFLGINWKFSRVTNSLELKASAGKQADIVQEVLGVMKKMLRQHPHDYAGAVWAAHDTLVHRTQYFRQAGAADDQVWGEAHDQILRYGHQHGWPLDNYVRRYWR